LSSRPERSEVEGPAVLSSNQRIQSEALPFPLSSRAQPRDLQFYRPVLEMFFEGGGLGSEARRADRQTSAQPGRAGASIPQHCPSAVGAAHFHLNLHQYSVGAPRKLACSNRWKTGPGKG
jgi:hypothetical protein